MLDQLMTDNVTRTRKYLFDSDLPEDSKDTLSSLLDSSAAAAAGAGPELKDMAYAQLHGAIYSVKHAIRMPITINTIVQDHAVNCPLGKRSGGDHPMPVGTVAIIVDLLHNPWFCMLVSVCVFSPNFPGIVTAIESIFK